MSVVLQFGEGGLDGRRGIGTNMKKNWREYYLYYVEYLRIEVDRGRNGEGGRKSEREIRREGRKERVCFCVEATFLIQRI